MNKTLKKKHDKYNYSIKQKKKFEKNKSIYQDGGNFLRKFTLSKDDTRINNLFKNFIVKLVKKSIPSHCKNSGLIYSEGTKVWNQTYNFSSYSSFLNSTNIYKCRNASCGISDKKGKDYKYNSIALNSCINNLFIQTVIKHEINKGSGGSYANLNTWQCLTTDKKYTKFIIVPDSKHIIDNFNQSSQFSRFVSGQQFFDFMLGSKKLGVSKTELVNKYFLSSNLTKFLTKIFNSIDLLFKNFQFQHYNLTLKNILVPVNKAFNNDTSNINSNIYNALNNPVIFNYNKSAITINIQDIPYIKAKNLSGSQNNKCNANYVRIRPSSLLNIGLTKNYSSIFKSKFLPHSSNIPDKMVLVKSVADAITFHAGSNFLSEQGNLDKFLENVDTALSNSSSNIKCGVVSTKNIDNAGRYWPTNTFSKIKDRMATYQNAVYFFEKFDIDKDKTATSSSLNNNLYVIENILQPNSELSVYGKNGTTDLANLNLSQLHSKIALLHDDSVGAYQKYSDDPSNENHLDNQFSINHEINHDDSFQSSNNSTGLLDIPIPHDKKPGDFLNIKDHRGEDARIRIPPGVEPGKTYSAIYTHNDTGPMDKPHSIVNTDTSSSGSSSSKNLQLFHTAGEKKHVNFDLI